MAEERRVGDAHDQKHLSEAQKADDEERKIGTVVAEGVSSRIASLARLSCSLFTPLDGKFAFFRSDNTAQGFVRSEICRLVLIRTTPYLDNMLVFPRLSLFPQVNITLYRSHD